MTSEGFGPTLRGMKRVVVITIRKITRVRVVVPNKGESMKKKLVLATLVLGAAMTQRVHSQPFAAGLQTPSRMIFTHHGNVLVAESGTPAPNSGRISFIDRTSGARKPLIDGLPSGVSGAGAEAAPSGPS